jgi:hypothetical protein
MARIQAITDLSPSPLVDRTDPYVIALRIVDGSHLDGSHPGHRGQYTTLPSVKPT